MNDLLYRAMFGFLIADRQGVERNEAFKIGLLGAIDNSKGFVMPVLNAKLMADDKVEIENRKTAEATTLAEIAAIKVEIADLKRESEELVRNLYARDANGAFTADTNTLRLNINTSKLLINFIPKP